MKREEIYRAEAYDSEGTLAVPRGTPWDNSSLPQGGKSVTDKSAIIVKPSTAQAFETLWKRGRVLFSAHPAASERQCWPIRCWTGGPFCG